MSFPLAFSLPLTNTKTANSCNSFNSHLMFGVPFQPPRKQKHDASCSEFEMTRIVKPLSMESKFDASLTLKDRPVESEPTKTPPADLAAPEKDEADPVCWLCTADINFGLLMLALFYRQFGINFTSFVIFLYPAAYFMLLPLLRPEDHRHATISGLSMVAEPQVVSHLQNRLSVLMEYTIAYQLMANRTTLGQGIGRALTTARMTLGNRCGHADH
ncbi:hypothetical protein V8F33_004131 [Rhypophila sp. PSN 637]